MKQSFHSAFFRLSSIREITLNNSAVLALEDGSIFRGKAIGALGLSSGEVVFNTAMTGYQEILTDPSYARQIVTLTYPHIGNTGITSEDNESDRVWASGLVIRNLSMIVSSWRSEMSLDSFLKAQNVVSIAEIDTRRLTRHLRDNGPLNGCILSGDLLAEKGEQYAHEQARAFPGLKGMDLAKEVSVNKSYEWNEGVWQHGIGHPLMKHQNPFHVVAYDYGVKRNILRMLAQRNCKVTVVPAQTSAANVLALKPDGVFLSNGPGDPAPCDYAITAIREILQTDIPVFGICLGCQLLALACGAQTIKMRLGHHGANHPVQNLDDNTVLITSQNHGFAVDEASLPMNLRATHRSLFDGSLQGIERTDKPAFAFQGHPEAAPGPHDIAPLFDKFVDLMQKRAPR
jgi:carbamoyl-phosphate synthase small subunit